MLFIPRTCCVHFDGCIFLVFEPPVPLLGRVQMHQRTVFLPFFDRSTIPGLALLGAWFAGVFLGLWAACFYGDSVGALALAAGRAELTLRNSCVVTLLPLFLSAFAVFLFHRAGAYWASLIRGGILGFSLGSLTSAGGVWLGGLLLFSSLAVSPVILCFLWRRLCFGADGSWRDSAYAFFAALGISAMDIWVVAPFLAHALSF